MVRVALETLKRVAFLTVVFTLALTLLPATLYSAEDVSEAWVKRYNGPGNGSDSACAIALDVSGNVYVTGTSFGGSATQDDYATIKYDTNGNKLWVKRYNGPASGSDSASAIALDASGNVYVTGRSDGGGTSSDYTTIKYDSAGNELWVKRYNGPASGSDSASAIALDASGNVYVTGVSLGSGTGYDWATIKYDTNGNELWVRRYNGPGNDDEGAAAITIDTSGNVYVTGTSFGGEETALDRATVKYDSNGGELWVKRHDVGEFDWPSAITLDGSGNIYVSGTSSGSETDWGLELDYVTTKYDTNGNELWVRRYNGPGGFAKDSASGIAVDVTGNVYVTGWSTYEWYDEWEDTWYHEYDYATIKYDTNGNELWVRRYNGPGDRSDSASAIAVDGSGNVYVTGTSFGGNATQDDYATIKYTQTPFRPTVISTSPTNNRTRVAISSSITATFSEDMDRSTINTSTFTLKDSTGTLVSGTVSYDPATKTAAFDPTANLSYGTTYAATVKGGASGVRDLAGNALASDYSWSFTTNYRPTADSISPISGSTLPGVPRSFAATFSDGDGWEDIQEARFLVSTSSATTGAVQVRYNQNTNKLYLRNDSNSSWLGGYAPGSTRSDGTDRIIENSYAKLNVTKSVPVSGSGNSLTVTWSLTFKDAFSGRKYNTYLYIKDDQGISNGGWQKKGTFTVNRPPSVGTIAPSSGIGPPDTAQTFTATYLDSDGWDKSSGTWVYSASEGWRNIAEARLLINTLVSGANAIYVYYSQNTNKLYIRNDANTAWMGGYAPGTTNPDGSDMFIENSYGRLNVTDTTTPSSGNTLTVSWVITPKTTMSGRIYNAYLYTKDDAGAADGWTKKGTYAFDRPPVIGPFIVPPPGPPGTEQVLTATYLDFDPWHRVPGGWEYSESEGWKNINVVRLLINTVLSGLGGIYVYYDQDADKFYLRNDTNTAWLGGYAPGSTNPDGSDRIIENSYGKVNVTATSAAGSGNVLTIKLTVIFKSSMSGKTYSVYSIVTDDAGASSDWRKKGTWRVL